MSAIILRIIPLQFKALPVHSTILILAGVVQALLMTAGVITTQRLFDTIASASERSLTFWDATIPLLALGAATFGQHIINGVLNFYMQGFIEPKTTGKLRSLLHLKLQALEPVNFENTAFLDDLNKAREGAGIISFFILIMFIFISTYLVYLIVIGGYLFSLHPMLLIILVTAFIPAMLGQVVRAKVFTNLEEEVAPIRREYEYYQSTLCAREYFKETRILGAYRFFHKLFSETMLLFTQKQWQAERKTALLQLFLNISSFAGMAAATYLLFNATIAGDITVGAFVAVFAALGMVFGLMQQMI